jgi:hypothetical protein
MRIEKRLLERGSFIITATMLLLWDCDGYAEGQPYETYLRFDGGVQRQQDLTIAGGDGARISFERGLRFDVTAGVFESEFCALELETGLLHNSGRSTFGVPVTATAQSLDVYQLPFMLNGVCKLPLGRHFNIRGGLGVGYVYSLFWGGDLDSADRTFGFQGTVGAHYSIGEILDLGVSYKFLATTEHCLGSGVKAGGTRSHALLAGVAFRF